MRRNERRRRKCCACLEFKKGNKDNAICFSLHFQEIEGNKVKNTAFLFSMTYNVIDITYLILFLYVK